MTLGPSEGTGLLPPVALTLIQDLAKAPTGFGKVCMPSWLVAKVFLLHHLVAFAKKYMVTPSSLSVPSIIVYKKGS